MDNLILSFTPEQHQKYLEILNADTISLNFSVSHIEIEDLVLNTNSTVEKMAKDCEKILAFAKKDSFFSKSLSREDIDALVPVYYEVISNVESAKAELYTLSVSLSSKITEIDTALNSIYSQYSHFLPYKAALLMRDDYKDKISEIDACFTEEIQTLSEKKERYFSSLIFISNICDTIIPEFLRASALYADTPRFKSFDDKNFFNAVESFVLKIRSV